jgi:hypothetical protein
MDVAGYLRHALALVKRITARAHVLQSDKTKARRWAISLLASAARPGRAALASTTEKGPMIPDSYQ